MLSACYLKKKNVFRDRQTGETDNFFLDLKVISQI